MGVAGHLLDAGIEVVPKTAVLTLALAVTSTVGAAAAVVIGAVASMLLARD